MLRNSTRGRRSNGEIVAHPRNPSIARMHVVNLMIIKTPLLIAGLCTAFMSSATAENAAGKSESTPHQPTPTSSAAHPPKPAPTRPEKAKPTPPQVTSDESTSTETQASESLEEANEKHIRPARTLVTMETPPPGPRTEKKPPLPAPGLVWMPGHWTPVKGEWQWTPGEWGIPATPVSVWIEPRYDAKTKQWRPGYWQPDRAAPYEPEKSQDDHPPTPKFL